MVFSKSVLVVANESHKSVGPVEKCVEQLQVVGRHLVTIDDVLITPET